MHSPSDMISWLNSFHPTNISSKVFSFQLFIPYKNPTTHSENLINFNNSIETSALTEEANYSSLKCNLTFGLY